MTNVKTEQSSSTTTPSISSSSNQDNNNNSTAVTVSSDKNSTTTNNNDSQNNLQPTPGSLKNVSDRVLIAKAKLVESPYDLDAWNILIKDVQNKNPEIARELYEQLVSQFPTSGRFWRLSIEHEIKSKNYERVEKLFQRCLVKVLNIDLWKCYLNYIKEAKYHLPSFREKMGQAFDFALEKMGIDINSYSIYNDYVQFLKGVDAQGSYAENQKISAVRRVYQRGIVIPMLNIETFWKEYLAYEQSINSMFVDKAIADRSKDYMNARRVAKEFEAITRGLNRNAPAVPPQSTPEENRQVELWKKYIQWEKQNPLKTEDVTLVIKRVVFAYEQCLLCLGHHPDIWYEYASYLDENSKIMAEKGDMNHHKALQEDVASVYERATSTLLKENILLHFSYADFEESRNRKDESIKIYEKLLRIKTASFNPTLTYIQYMKFTRRTESMSSARAIFKRARSDSRSSYEVYIAAAMTEYYCSKNINISCKIFELGLKRFPHEAPFILAYIDFLGHLNEENNIRVLFERVLSSDTFPISKSLEIWNRFLEFESQIGDLASVINVEKRRSNVIEKLQQQQQRNHSETAWLVDRYKFLHLMPCSQEELKSIGYFNINPSAASLSSSSLSSSSSTIKESMVNGHQSKMSMSNDRTSINQRHNSQHSKQSSIPVPNLTQMVPFKPVQNPVNNLMPGGIFPYPPSVTSLLSQLPPPLSFRGPFVNIDELMSLFKTSPAISFLTDPSKTNCLMPTEAKAYFALALEATDSFNFGNGIVNNTGSSGTKRSAGQAMLMDEDDDGDGEGSNLMPPQFDIYRSRQMHKKSKNM
ncbi:Cleavage stimulation factor subunit 3 [Dermatophagoides pteronyssinus]|uniref:Cleavage stimulation factor subunit 3 n=3 Tax=Dermatophagoides pteronyssinus TaxID=6956 RepID=A0ABQ8IXN2_DERPT|nr:cleavage stimulation factor subunit 3-like [Dermatophagoides pteronyssinus]KAH9415072.1 Cleavage stimulation factor subunit 3 [Dermatophagoides pteronyssinus]